MIPVLFKTATNYVSRILFRHLPNFSIRLADHLRVVASMIWSTKWSIGWMMNGITPRPIAVGAQRRTTGELFTVCCTTAELSATY